MRLNVYIDGFNLYYGCLQGTPHRWLDLEALCRRLFPTDTINRIRHFTALVSSRAGGPQKPQRQQVYLRALGTLPLVSIHLGHFLTSTVRMAVASAPAMGPRTIEVIRTEERGSDVNPATYLLLDAFRGDFKAAAVISNDSDVEPHQPKDLPRQTSKLTSPAPSGPRSRARGRASSSDECRSPAGGEDRPTGSEERTAR